MTRATGREMAMAATFIMKLVMTITKNEMPITKINQWASLNITSQLTASHSAAPVSHKQKPMLMAPAKRRIMFHEISSRSLRSSISRIKNKIVEIRMMAVLSMGSSAGINERNDIVRTQLKIIRAASISFRVTGPNSASSCFALFLNPGITFFSGLKKIMKNPHKRKVINQPTGNM